MARVTSDEKLHGAGPWQFDIRALEPGEKAHFNLTEMRFNGQKGWFKKHLPLDVAQVTNLSTDNGVEVVYNNRYEDYVVPNAVETFSDQGIVSVKIINPEGNTQIAEGNVKLSLKKEPYGDDDQAREQASNPWVVRAANDIIPGGLPGGR